MTQFLFQIIKKKHLANFLIFQKMKMDHRFIAFKKLKKKIKIL